MTSTLGEQIYLAALVPGSTGLQTQTFSDKAQEKTPVQTGWFGDLCTHVCHPKGLCIPAGAASLFLHWFAVCNSSITSGHHGDSAVRACSDPCSLCGMRGSQES